MSIESQIFDPNEHRREAMEDGSGFSTFLAETRTGFEPLGSKKVTRPRAQKRKPRRRVVEPGGRDVARMMANQDAIEHPMSVEERKAASVRGAALAREALKKAGFGPIDRAAAHIEATRNPDAYDAQHEAESIDRSITAVVRTIVDHSQ